MSEFVPICDLPEFGEVTFGEAFNGEAPLIWGLPLPAHLDTERIQVNIDRIARLHRVGAFSASIVSDYQGDTSESHSVAGINFDGSAVAGKSKNIKKAENTNSAMIDSQIIKAMKMEQDYGRSIAHHKLNRPELVQNVIDAKHRGKSDEVAWAECLDGVLRESYRNAGRQHLIGRASVPKKFWNYFYTSWAMSCTALDASQAKPSAILAVYSTLYGLNLGCDLVAMKKLYGQNIIKDRRWSVCISDVQPDRYIALNSLSRVSGLVTAVK